LTATVRVCFVCLGNICRSPSAEGVMRRLVEDAGLSHAIRIDSAGTAAFHVGERPDHRAREAARRRGLQLDRRAKQFLVHDFSTRDYVLAMDRENLAQLESLAVDVGFEGVLALLRSFDPLAPTDAEVPDPYYGEEGGFDEVLDLCEAACRGLLDRIRDELPTP
jgi:protein-tyrosine phosphatase